jgi:hypothetical protein
MSDGTERIPVRIVRLEALVQGLAAGLLVGLGFFVATMALVLKGGPVVGPHLVLLSQFFVGYDVSVTGSFVALAWGGFYGFVAGYFVSAVYNWVVALKSAKRAATPDKSELSSATKPVK